jgi:putative nucleotidyltransferase with HDIG domain
MSVKNDKLTFTDKDMTGVPIDDFITGNTIPVDVYVRLADNKYVKLVKAGSQAQRESLSSYQNKKVDILWVHRSDLPQLTNIHIAIAGILVGKAEISVGQKTRVLSTAAKSVYEEIGQMGVNEKIFGAARKISESIVKLVEHQKDFATLIESLNEFSDELLRHSMAVSAFSTIGGVAMKWKKEDSLEKLSLGGLLHDIGKKTMSPELLKKSKFEMSYDELKEYEAHPFKGMQMLTQLSVIPREVVSMVYEHHENSVAQGFPQKLRDYRINPFAKVIAMANEFANLTIKNPTHQTPLSPNDALDYIERTMGQPFNKDVFKAFKNHVFAFNVKKSA